MNQVTILMKYREGEWIYDKKLNEVNRGTLEKILNEKTLKEVCERCEEYRIECLEEENRHIEYIVGVLFGEKDDYSLVAYGGVKLKEK